MRECNQHWRNTLEKYHIPIGKSIGFIIGTPLFTSLYNVAGLLYHGWYTMIYIYYSGPAWTDYWCHPVSVSSSKLHEYHWSRIHRLLNGGMNINCSKSRLFPVPTLPPLATKLGISKWYVGHIHTNHESNLVFLHSEILYSTSHPVPTSLSGNGAHHHRNQPFVVTSPTIRCAMRVVGWVGIHQHHSRVGLCILEIQYLDLGSYINR